jgi:hypothetical protein
VNAFVNHANQEGGFSVVGWYCHGYKYDQSMRNTGAMVMVVISHLTSFLTCRRSHTTVPCPMRSPVLGLMFMTS